ncbi:FtsX-like permease family protein [Tepidimicrobium xylanilyticum]|uniref:Putative ABC transport system permease protein n=1 Tax=Tepidimicrobium xylanilyticum TaxID=1123352 RepID=A0A1H2XGH8_9FIRM|nr:ABC transporter permease [Tepidimicrobium xylanilyticum]SDW92013.1 putative ABC transport system permease protein [Tepidimicrobium xylanilyticum]
MSSFKLTIMSFRRNIKTYGMYLMAMIFSVATYYNFVSMRYNPQFQETKDLTIYVQSSSVTASLLMILFLVFFIMYSSNFFLNQRKKEIGVYAFMGIDNYKIAFIFASEGLLLGIMSLVIGLLLGTLFSKLFLMLLAKAALLKMRIDFFISKKALIETIIVYSVILFIAFLKGYINIIRTNLIDLMNTLKKAEELPKVNYLKGFASLIIIGVAYYIAVNYGKLGFGNALLWTVILVIIGTYWLFGSFLSMVIRYFIKRKKFLYKGTNIISFSNIAFRIKDNYRTFAAVAVLITTCITSFGTVSSLRYYVDENHKIEVPYTVTYISSNKEEIDRVDEIIENSHHNVELREKANFLFVPDSKIVVVKLSTFQRILTDLNVKDRDRIISKIGLLEEEVAYIERPGVFMNILEKKDIKVGDKAYKIKARTKVPLFGSGVPFPCVIVNDEEYAVLKLKFEEKQFNGIILDNPENTKDLTFKLAEILPEESGLYTYFMAGVTFYDLVGIVYFLGAFLFLVFVFATGSIIYFKILSESFRDKGKYEILKKIGTTDFEINESVSKQVGMFFLLPLIVGIIHSIVAISVLSDLMKYSLTIPTVISIMVFIIVYGIFYIFTRRKYVNVVGGQA